MRNILIKTIPLARWGVNLLHQLVSGPDPAMTMVVKAGSEAVLIFQYECNPGSGFEIAAVLKPPPGHLVFTYTAWYGSSIIL
jgi:hypothetical protein